MIEALENGGIHAAVIGCITEKERIVTAGDIATPLTPPQKDELFSV